jgi:hypothetical protein
VFSTTSLPRKCFFTFFLIALTAAAGHSAEKAGAPSVLVADKGKFVIKLDGKTVGHEEFEISPSEGGWVAKGTTEIKPDQGPSEKITGTLVLQPNGAPISYAWSAQTEKRNSARILFANGVAKISLEMQGAKPYEQDVTFNTALVAILDNNLYHQYAVLARVYDWSKRGEQSFPVLIPQELTPGSITVKYTGASKEGGTSYEGLRVTTSDLEVLLVLDASHKLIRLEVPAAKVAVIRE